MFEVALGMFLFYVPLMTYYAFCYFQTSPIERWAFVFAVTMWMCGLFLQLEAFGEIAPPAG